LIAGLLAVAGVAHAAGPVAGPIEVGPSAAAGNPQQSAARLDTTLTNYGAKPDRLIRADCPAVGQIALRNGSQHGNAEEGTVQGQMAGQNQQQYGLDVPATLDGKPQPVRASFDLTNATQPVTPGALLPCALYFAHSGERVVVFDVGAHEEATREP